MSQKISISQTIFKQLQESTLSGYMVQGAHMSAWGVKGVKGNDEPDNHGLGWIHFNVEGSKYKGSVRVALQPNNSYTVTFEGVDNVSTVSRKFYSLERIHYTQLAESIDNIVEGEQ